MHILWFLLVVMMLNLDISTSFIISKIKNSCGIGYMNNRQKINLLASKLRWFIPLQMKTLGDDIHEGDVILSNHPQAGGSHLPDLTVITPVSCVVILICCCSNLFKFYQLLFRIWRHFKKCKIIHILIWLVLCNLYKLLTICQN